MIIYSLGGWLHYVVPSREQFNRNNDIQIVESQIKVFPHLVFIFGVPAKASNTWCINYPALVFLNVRVYLHLFDENSVSTWSLYRISVYAKHEGYIFPNYGFCILCLLKVSMRHWLVGQRTISMGKHDLE
jgi:hypothetical protein